VPLKPGHEAPPPGERPSVERPAEEEIPAAAKPFRARAEVERPRILAPFEAYRPREKPPRPELWEAVAKAAREEEEAMKPPAAAARPTAPWMRRPGAPPAAAPSPGAVPPWRRTGAAAPPVAPAPAPPSGPPPPVAARPAIAPPRTTLDPEIWFPLDDLWGRVRALKAAPGFAAARGGIIVPISAAGRDLKTQAADAIAFFRIPPDFVQRTPEESWWEDLLRPFLEELERAIRSKAPADIKGDFQFAVAPDGTFGMLYLE
jgi:Meckel syndrome type 1 protein